MKNTEMIDNVAPPSQKTIDKHNYALDALSKLTIQFAINPDFNNLLNILLMTISGQFATTSAFAYIFNPNANDNKPIFLGLGKFQNDKQLHDLVSNDQFINLFPAHQRPLLISELTEIKGEIGLLAESLGNLGVSAIIGLPHGDRYIGIIGIGEKVNKKPLGESDLDLFASMIITITPLIVNSFLFMEIHNLSAWYRDILNGVNQGVITMDMRHRILDINSAGRIILEHIHGKKIINSQNDIEYLFPAELFPGWIEYILEAIITEENITPRQLISKSPDGEHILNVQINRIESKDLNQRDYILIFDDITAQKESEQRLYQQEKLAEKGLMASSIAHELNNFLTLILGGIEITLLAVNNKNPERVMASLDKLKIHAEAMERFTAGLMDYGRMDSTKKLIDLNSLISDVLLFLRVQKKFKSLKFIMELQRGLPKLLLDEDQIAQLLINFLNNSADAIEEKDSSHGKIEICSFISGNKVGFSIEDNGKGIPPEIKNRLFKSYLTTKKHGHGYGLATCARILRQHGAEFNIKSEVGVGTKITIEFSLEE